jgi:hypothetical protein
MYERFNEHLGKKGISGRINVDYKEQLLSVEVICFPYLNVHRLVS